MTTDTRVTNPRDPRRIEYRAVLPVAAEADGVLAGYGSTWWSVDSYGTAFAPGCWTKTLQERADRIHFLWAHDASSPIGVPTVLEEDGSGLRVEVALVPGVQRADEALALLRAGQESGRARFGLSVGFRTLRERPADPATDPLTFNDGSPAILTTNPEQVYVIEEAKLYEVSLVAFPANEDAMVSSARSDAVVEGLAAALADLQAGRLAPAARDIVADLVDAWPGLPGGTDPAPRPAKAPRDDAAALAVLERMRRLAAM